MITAITAVGCGKKKTEEPKQEAQATVTPAENTDTAGNDEGTLVDMQKSDDSDIKNVIGDKTTTASKLIIVNETGSDIAGIYVRPTTDDDDDWGDELIKGLFTLKDDDKALYYYDKNVKDASGKTVTSFDIRIVYADDSLTDCYFRKLPLTTITQITLKMDGSGDDAIPYATYLTASSKKETSTLNEVKKRLGLDDSSDEEDDDTPGNRQRHLLRTARQLQLPHRLRTIRQLIRLLHRFRIIQAVMTVLPQTRRSPISASLFPV